MFFVFGQSGNKGFVGRLIKESNLEIAFVDKDSNLVEALNKSPFKVSFFGNVREAVTVSDYKAYTWDNADISDAELIFVSVGGSNLAEQNIRYITHPMAGYEPAIYTDIPKTLTVEEVPIK